MENATYLQNIEKSDESESINNEQNIGNETTFEVDSIEEITPALFSEDENVNSFNQKDNIKEEPKLFEEDNKHDDFEIPAFLRKQKN
jgi:hypothetical protein